LYQKKVSKMIIVKGQQNAEYNNGLGEQIINTLQTVAQAGGNLYSTWSQGGGQAPAPAPGSQETTPPPPPPPVEKRILGMQPYVFYILTGVVVLGVVTAVVYYVKKNK
jgi:hypothetical protein